MPASDPLSIVRDLVVCSYTFAGWNTQADGDGTDYAEGADYTANATVTLFAKWILVGNAGPAGGLIFYDKGYIGDGWRYLEAAPQGWKDTDDPLISWGSHTLIGSTSDSVGSGEANTENIFSVLGEGTYAAKACIDYSVTVNSVVYDDWFLPSWDELDLMYKNLYQKGLGGFMYAWYWSSSEADRSAAKFQSFQDGDRGAYSQKSTERRVRPVRAY